MPQLGRFQHEEQKKEASKRKDETANPTCANKSVKRRKKGEKASERKYHTSEEGMRKKDEG